MCLGPPGTLSREWLDLLAEGEEANVELGDRGEDKGVKGHPGKGGNFGFSSKCDEDPQEGPDRTVWELLFNSCHKTVSFWRSPLAALERTPWMRSLGVGGGVTWPRVVGTEVGKVTCTVYFES